MPFWVARMVKGSTLGLWLRMSWASWVSTVAEQEVVGAVMPMAA